MEYLCISILEFKWCQILNKCIYYFNLCISILEFKLKVNQEALKKISDLCISILEFKWGLMTVQHWYSQ